MECVVPMDELKLPTTEVGTLLLSVASSSNICASHAPEAAPFAPLIDQTVWSPSGVGACRETGTRKARFLQLDAPTRILAAIV